MYIYIVAGKEFGTTIDHLKVEFFRAFNCIFAHSKAANSEIVSVELLNKSSLFTFFIVCYRVCVTFCESYAIFE